jgi:hypothetical protein
MGGLASLYDALDYLDLLAEAKPEILRQCRGCAGDREAVELLRRLVRRVQPIRVPRVS